jgi:hypothetical protein
MRFLVFVGVTLIGACGGQVTDQPDAGSDAAPPKHSEASTPFEASLPGCPGNGFCASSPDGVVCLPDHACGCTTAKDCLGSENGKACVSSRCGCTLDVDCQGEHCDSTDHRCYACLVDAQCAGSPGPKCVDHSCICTSSSDCPPDEVCTAQGLCY